MYKATIESLDECFAVEVKGYEPLTEKETETVIQCQLGLIGPQHGMGLKKFFRWRPHADDPKHVIITASIWFRWEDVMQEIERRALVLQIHPKGTGIGAAVVIIDKDNHKYISTGDDDLLALTGEALIYCVRDQKQRGKND